MTDNIVKSPRGRTKRVAQIARGPLSVRGKENGFHYRIVNDIDDRIVEFQEAGYEVVKDTDVSIGDKRVDKSSNLGGAKHFAVGGGQKAVLMRIRQDWYDEDQAEKANQIAQQELAIKKDALGGTDYGKYGRDRSLE